MRPRRLNGKALLILVLSAAALAGGTALAHSFQVKRNAAALIDQAKQAEAEGKGRQAAYYLRQYISLNPNETEARARYGLLLKGLATTRQERNQALATLEEVLRRDESLADARRAAADLAIQLGRTKEAQAHLTRLLADSPEDAELCRLLGWCEFRAVHLNEAADRFIRAGRLAPNRVDLCVDVATALRWNLQRPPAADQVIEQMVAALPQDVPARLAAVRYYRQAGIWDQADKQIRFAVDTLHAKDAEWPLLAAEVAAGRKQPDEARAQLERGLKEYPGDPRLSRLLARMELAAGRKDKASELIDAATPEKSKNATDVWSVATLLIDLGKTDEANKLIQELTARGGPHAAAMVAELQGQMFVRKRAWGEARAALEKARATTQIEPQLNLRVNLLLAECYQQQGSADQLLLAYNQALKIDPTLVSARRGHAAALAAVGKTDEAIAAFRGLAAVDPNARMDLARVLLARNRRRPAPERDWAEFEEVMQAMLAHAGNAPAIRMLQFEALLARDKREEARWLMEAERDRDPKQVGPWRALIALAARQKPPAAVPALLAEAERQTGWQLDWELVKASQAVRAGGTDAVRQLQQLEAGVEKCPDADKGRLLGGLAEAYRAIGDRSNSRRLWKRAADRAADNLAVRFSLFELALQDGDAAEAERVRDEIGRVEGPGGPVGCYCAAACQLLPAHRNDKASLAAARLALGRAAEQRPTWSRVALLDAEFCELEGRMDRALEKYQEALDHGDGRLIVVRRILELLYEQHRYAEANLLLRKVPEPALEQTDLGRIAAQLLAASPEDAAGLDPAAARARALQLARQAVAVDAKDYRRQLWLGHLAAQTGQADEAEKAFRRAVEVADTVPDTWASLVLFLARTNPKKAEAELERAKAKLPKDQLPLALAPCYEVLGRTELADQQYQAALLARPADPTVLRAVAAFYGRTGQAIKAVPVLRRIIDSRTDASSATVAWARRALALCLPVMGNYQQFKDAVALLDANLADGRSAVEDRLTKALLLATQPAHRREAIGLFESLPVRQNALPPDAEFLLAQLYEADGDWAKCRAHLLALVNEHDKNPVYVAGYVRALLRHDVADEARVQVDRLATLRPDAAETAELRVRVLKAEGRTADAAAAIQAFAAAGKGTRLVQAALMLEDIGRPEEAEPLFREFAAAPGKPDASLPYAAFLGRTGRVAESLTICELAWKTCPPETVARACVTIVRPPQGTDEQRRRVEGRLRDAIAKHPQAVMLQVTLADLQDAGGRHDEAVALYRRVIQDVPGNVIALNNLAFVLAMRGGPPEESLALINRAIDIAGPFPELLDTRAVIYMKSKQFDEAVRDLQHSLAQSPSASVYYHLALAQLALKNRPGAGDAFRKATAAKLKASSLHPLEQGDYRLIAEELRFE